MDLGENIKEARKNAKMTQKAVAEILDVRQKDVSRWETNVQTPNIITFKKLCQAIGASADKILELNN